MSKVKFHKVAAGEYTFSVNGTEYMAARVDDYGWAVDRADMTNHSTEWFARLKDVRRWAAEGAVWAA